MARDAKIRIQLAECAEIAAGFPFRGAVDGLPGDSVAVIQMRNVEDAVGVDWPSLATVDLPTKRKPDLLLSGDVILAARGRRYFALALTEIPVPAVCSPHFFVIRAKASRALLPEFLAWQINQRPAQDYLQQSATGSHILNLTRGVVEALPVTIPPKSTQAAVVALECAARSEMAALHALIDNRRSELDAVAIQILNSERLPA